MPIDMGAEQEEDHGHQIPRYHLLQAFRRHLRWRLCLASYLAIVGLGVFLLATYELPGDIRYRPDLRAASRDPKPEGYGSGGKCTSISPVRASHKLNVTSHRKDLHSSYVL